MRAPQFATSLLADYLLGCRNISKDDKRLIQAVRLNMSDCEMTRF